MISSHCSCGKSTKAPRRWMPALLNRMSTAADARFDRGHAGVDGIAIGDVEGRTSRPRALRRAATRPPESTRVLPASVEDHLRAGSREALRDRETETAVRARDQRDLARKIEGLLHAPLRSGPALRGKLAVLPRRRSPVELPALTERYAATSSASFALAALRCRSLT